MTQTANPESAARVLLITADVLGQGDKSLGSLLMKNYLKVVSEDEDEFKPQLVLLINTGVLLAVEGSPVGPLLAQLADGGTTVLSCGTCLDHYQVREKLAVGQVTNMFAIRDYLARAEKVITL